MKKTAYEKGFKYVYTYNKDKLLINVKFYTKKLFGLLSSLEGEYAYTYDKDELIYQQNFIKTLGLTEAVNYFYDANGRLSKKEYYNNRMALRYTVIFEYEKDMPCRMEVKQFNGRLVLDTKDKTKILKYLSKTGREIDFLSDMLLFAEELNK
jgi:hypothetical protein